MLHPAQGNILESTCYTPWEDSGLEWVDTRITLVSQGRLPGGKWEEGIPEIRSAGGATGGGHLGCPRRRRPVRGPRTVLPSSAPPGWSGRPAPLPPHNFKHHFTSALQEMAIAALRGPASAAGPAVDQSPVRVEQWNANIWLACPALPRFSNQGPHHRAYCLSSRSKATPWTRNSTNFLLLLSYL